MAPGGMALAITPGTALWFLPFVLPICLWVAYTDLSAMRIRNMAVLALALVFLLVGPLALPLAEYPWRLVTLAVALVVGMALNAAGVMGAGDAKFIAAAAPFVDPGDAGKVALLFTATALAGFAAHRLVRESPLRRLAPDWQSWRETRRFPLGFPLGGTLVLYLLLGATGA